MTDLSRVLPDFPGGQYGSLIPALEKNGVTTTDLLTLGASEIGKRTQLPLLDVRRLCDAVLRALHADLGVPDQVQDGASRGGGGGAEAAPGREAGKTSAGAGTSTSTSTGSLRRTPSQLAARWSTISTLDPVLDSALGGGVPTGCITEITGEAGAGKTQLLLSLLLAAQLPPPHGLGRPSIYISTEAALPTRRLAQMLAANPLLRSLPPGTKAPSLDSIFSIVTPDLESQDHILTFQVPVEAVRRNVGLVVLDSVAANFRAEFERGGARGSSSSNNMGARTAELVRLGMLLRDLAQSHNMAVVVANQVADRFGPKSPPPRLPPTTTPAARYGLDRPTQESPLAARTRRAGGVVPEPASSFPDFPPEPLSSAAPLTQQYQQQGHQQHNLPALALDHQQRWFTGWGDEEDGRRGPHVGEHKTPSLGLVWTTQITARIALLKRPSYGHALGAECENDDEQEDEDEDEDGAGNDEDNRDEYSGDTSAIPVQRTWRRWMKVVFASYAAPSGPGLVGATEFEITSGGLRGLRPRKRRRNVGAAKKAKQ